MTMTPMSDALIRKQKRAIYKNLAAQMLISIPETLNFGVIFVFHHTPHFLFLLFNTALRFVLFPIAAIASIAKAVLAWDRYLNDLDYETGKRKVFNAVQAVWDTLQAGGVTGAVITGIVGAAMGVAVGFGIAVTFAVLLAASTIYQACITGYFAYKAQQSYKAFLETGDSRHKTEYNAHLSSVKNNAFGTIIIGLLCTGIVLAMVAGFPFTGAIIGAVTCGVAVIYGAYSLYKHYQTREKSSVRDDASRSLLAHDELANTSSYGHMFDYMPPMASASNAATQTVASANTASTITVDDFATNPFNDMDAHDHAARPNF